MTDHIETAAHNTAICADLVRRHDHDRYLTALTATPADRSHLFALYAFNHEIAKTREMVSEPLVGEIRLQWWADAIDEIGTVNQRAHPVIGALARAVEARGLPSGEFHAVIDARRRDLDGPGFADLGTLSGYARKSGGVLQKLAMRICSGTGEAGLSAAEHAGTAFALTGIIRAVAFQAAMQHHQLPKSELAAAGIDETQIFRGELLPELGDVVRKIADEANRCLKMAAPEATAASRRALPALLCGVIAMDYLRRLDKIDYRIERLHLEPGRVARLWRIAKCYLAGHVSF